MNGTRDQFLAGAALAVMSTVEAVGATRRCAGRLPASASSSDHVVIEVDLRLQPVMRVFDSLHLARVLEGRGGDARDRHHHRRWPSSNRQSGPSASSRIAPMSLLNATSGAARTERARSGGRRFPIDWCAADHPDQIAKHAIEPNAAH